MSMRMKKFHNFLRPTARHLTASGIAARAQNEIFRSLILGECIVIPRSLLHFERIKYPEGTEGEIRSAITIQGRALSPFLNPGIHIDWQPDHAVIWSWDADFIAEFGVTSSSWTLPEPAVDTSKYAPPNELSGCTEIDHEDGIEAVIFEDTHLVASRFWKRSPNRREIDRWYQTALSAKQAHFNSETQLSPPRGLGVRSWLLNFLNPARASALVILALIPAAAMRLGELGKAYSVHQSARAELEEISGEGAANVAAMAMYQTYNQRIRTYQETLLIEPPLRPVVEFAEVSAEYGLQVQSIEVSNGRLSGDVSGGSAADLASIVRALEAQASLTDTRIDRASSSVFRIEARTSGRPTE